MSSPRCRSNLSSVPALCGEQRGLRCLSCCGRVVMWWEITVLGFALLHGERCGAPGDMSIVAAHCVFSSPGLVCCEVNTDFSDVDRRQLQAKLAVISKSCIKSWQRHAVWLSKGLRGVHPFGACLMPTTYMLYTAIEIVQLIQLQDSNAHTT